ncbi:hypothetical protein AB0E88_20480 [Streptomyces sp. NPDC028635]|uniref:hypothetical protein n=1 Tax=Streptomyces sp. NPDC028635 TaxID=3154800 RepID=UPI0033E26D2D
MPEAVRTVSPLLVRRTVAREDPALLTWQPAFPGAAVRVVRAVAGRRVLQAALLLGGLFVLGLLCGQRAQAAEPVPTAPATQTKATGAGASTETPSLPRSATRHGAQAVDVRGKRPAGALRNTVKAGIGNTAPALHVLPPEASLPSEAPSPLALPTAQQLPMPSVPSVPSVPFPPGAPGVHGDGGVRAGHGAAATPAGPVRVAGGTAFRARPSGPVAAPAQPRPGRAVHPFPAHTPSAHADSAHPGRDTVPQGPGEGPAGAVVGGSAAGDGTPGHGDAHAVTPRHRLPLPVRAATVAQGAAPRIQDRYRDIPVFPA